MFKRKNEADKDGYHSSGLKAENIECGELSKIKVNGRILIITKLDDEIVAFSDTCPHGAASLSKGSLSKYKISCPDHGYCFDLRSGRITWPEDEPYRLRRYGIKVVDDQIRVRVDD